MCGDLSVVIYVESQLLGILLSRMHSPVKLCTGGTARNQYCLYTSNASYASV